MSFVVRLMNKAKFARKNSTMKKHNFGAGPAILPREVFEQAAEAVLDFDGSGLSLLEISHRSKEFTAVLDETAALIRELLSLNEDYDILFLSGGASTQFFMVPMNLLNEGETAAYVDTGSWSSKAIKEARAFGNVDVVASSKEDGYRHIPKGYSIPEDAVYLHLTGNNTIFGSQYFDFPDSPIPIVCDMSSDIFSRPVDVSNFGLIYAGAQKNLGPAGVTLVIIRKDMSARIRRTMPTMLDYRTHIKGGSTYNTPPVFPIYTSMLNLRWIKAQGGLPAMEKRNRAKADLLYAEIDRNALFEAPVATEDRSWMNANFIAKDTDTETAFIQRCNESGIVGIKGHRSVGGCRASMYNALGLDSVVFLVQLMQDFEQTYSR